MMTPLKLMSVVLVLALAVTTALSRTPRLPQSPCPSFSYDAVYDLQNNDITNSPYVTVQSAITGTGCSAQGVLKLALASAATDPNRRRVLIDLFFSNPTGWVFNLGDSSTNNGYAGDASTQTWDAEVQGTGTTFAGYLSDNGNSVLAFNNANLFTNRLTLFVGDGHISWIPDNNNLLNYYYNTAFFALNGQNEPDGTANYDLYLGLNRVISGNYRSGTGLCKVGIKFLKEF